MKRPKLLRFAFAMLFACGSANILQGDEPAIHSFERIQLTDTYYSEGANFGDINHDGENDIVYGPFWYAGPDYKTAKEIYPAKPQPTEAYADNFFNWVYDFNNDGYPDVFVVGFPGTPAYVYENPGKAGYDQHWKKHQVFDWVSNESPQFVNLVGDAKPELVCTRDGFFGYVTFDPAKPFETWKFQRISDQIATPRFGHGLGIGDVNGDGLQDVIMQVGWFEQPKETNGEGLWKLHSYEFTAAGGADMYAYDVDGDGDNDVISSLQAHAFGLAWFEQVKDGDATTFKQHIIMGDKPEDNKYGVLFTELHSVALEDIDGDGLKDIVTGKTYWSHHKQSPMWDAGAVVYWFKLERKEDGVNWLPMKADGESGIGRQLTVGHVNKDKLPDFVVGGMKGANVLIHNSKPVSEEEYNASLPIEHRPLADGLSPEEAAKNMTVPSGFHVQLAAGEPLVHQPVAFSIDHKGRIWIAEAYTYPQRAPEGQGKDKIVILEDKDLDGTFESRKIFAEGLNLVSGMEVGFGGVWIGAAPYLMFIPDANGDDVPDGEPQILLDGFGYQDTHETLNAFIWGPDGWLYGCHGVFTHSKVGKPGTPDKERTPMNAAVWRYHPTRHQFEVFAQGSSNPWGVDFNDVGEAFITACVIPHLYHVIPGARYQRQAGNHFEKYTFDDIKTIADHAHYVGSIQDHAWWGHEPLAPKGTLDAGGGHAHCGAMIYLGDNFPASYRDQIYMNNVHGNRVNCDLLEPEGSGYVGHHGKDLLIANDRWYRGINLKYGPDGSVYLIDWYDQNACHRTNPEIWDRTNGRLFNLAYGKVNRIQVDLTKMADVQLAELHLHKNDWYVRHARQILQERSVSRKIHDDALAKLKEIASIGEKSRRLRAIWTLHAVQELGSDVAKLIGTQDEHVSSWAIRLAVEDRQVSAEELEAMESVANKASTPVQRLAIASALQRLDLEQRWNLIESLVQVADDANDHNLPLMYWYAIDPLVGAEPAKAMALAQKSKIPLLTKYIIRRAASEDRLIGHVVDLLNAQTTEETRSFVLNEMLAAFEGRAQVEMPESWGTAYETLMKQDSASVRDLADRAAVIFGDKRIFPRMRSVLADEKASVDSRNFAIDILVRGQDKQAAASYQAAVATPGLRGKALRALATIDDPQTAEIILSAYANFSADDKKDAINTLVSRPSFAAKLLDAMADGKVARTDLHAFHVRQLVGFDKAELTDRIKEVWGEIRTTAADRQVEIDRLKKLLNEKAINDAKVTSGRLVFQKTCGNCHVLFGVGGKIGPDITGSNRANLDYILENVVDPSAVVGKDYLMTVVETNDGRNISGILKSESEDAITLQTLNEVVVVAKEDISERSLSQLSMMPEKLFEPLKEEEIASLVKYLASPTQVPLRGADSAIDKATGKVPGAIEGESMKIVGKTGGSATSQDMRGFTEDRWSGNDHLWWTGAKAGDKLELEFTVDADGVYQLETVLTMARDYAIVQLSIDGKKVGEPIDCFNNPAVVTTGVLVFDGIELKKGLHKIGFEIVGANKDAVKAFMVGVDFVRLKN